MPSNARRFVAFLATGCLAAGGVGWGVWRASTPETAISATNDIRTESSIASVDQISTVSSAPTNPSTTATSGNEGVVEGESSPAEISAQDPLLPPNAYIPPAGTYGQAQPTRTFSPQSPSVREEDTVPPSSAMTEPSEAQTGTETFPPTSAPTDHPGNTPEVPEGESTETDRPTLPSAPSTTEPDIGEGAPANPEVPDSEAKTTDVSPPTLTQPVPTTEPAAYESNVEPEPEQAPPASEVPEPASEESVTSGVGEPSTSNSSVELSGIFSEDTASSL